MLVRLARIAAIAVGFFFVFALSQQATAARNFGQTTAGLSWPIGVLALIFLLAAFGNERLNKRKGSSEDDLRTDFMWGLGVGGVAIVLERLQ